MEVKKMEKDGLIIEMDDLLVKYRQNIQKFEKRLSQIVN